MTLARAIRAAGLYLSADRAEELCRGIAAAIVEGDASADVRAVALEAIERRCALPEVYGWHGGTFRTPTFGSNEIHDLARDIADSWEAAPAPTVTAAAADADHRVVERIEPFTFADGSVRLAVVVWEEWSEPLTGAAERRCIGHRDIITTDAVVLEIDALAPRVSERWIHVVTEARVAVDMLRYALGLPDADPALVAQAHTPEHPPMYLDTCASCAAARAVAYKAGWISSALGMLEIKLRALRAEAANPRPGWGVQGPPRPPEGVWLPRHRTRLHENDDDDNNPYEDR